MRTQCWRRGVEKSWSSSSSSSRSLQKVSGIFEVRFLPWHGTISFFLHVCERHVLLVCPVLYRVWARLLFSLPRFDVTKMWQSWFPKRELAQASVTSLVFRFLIYTISNHKCCTSLCILSFNFGLQWKDEEEMRELQHLRWTANGGY